MLIGICADAHIGNHARHGGVRTGSINYRGQLTVTVFERAVKKAQDEGCDAFVVVGDVFDVCDPPAQFIAEVARILASCTMQVLLVLGNHDMHSTAVGDNALAPLGELANVQVVDAPGPVELAGETVLVFPYTAERPMVDQIARTMSMDGMDDWPVALTFIHAGLRDGRTAAYLQNTKSAVDVADLGTYGPRLGKVVFAGDWHDRRKWDLDGLAIIQCGALCPTGWDNPGFNYGSLYVYDTVATTVRELRIPGPRFLVVTSKTSMEKALDKAERNGDRLFARVDVPEGVEPPVCQVGGVLDAFETTLTRDSSVAAQAARAAQEGGTTMASVLGYVEALVVPPGVAKSDVLEGVMAAYDQASKGSEE